jgi:hypothetical protein
LGNFNIFIIIHKKQMKKLLFILLTIGMIGTSFSQMAVAGELFAANPSRFNGRQTTIKNVEIVKTHGASGPSIGGPAGSFQQGAPGAVGTPTAPTAAPCRPPRGFSEINVHFKGATDYKGCFFMIDAMKAELERQCGHESTPVQLTFRGDNRTGYNVTFYRLGM